MTLEEAIKAHDTLAKEGINIRVIDPFTLKPIDKKLLIDAAKATGGLVVTVEDHYDQGEAGGAYCSSVNISLVIPFIRLFFFLSPPPLPPHV